MIKKGTKITVLALVLILTIFATILMPQSKYIFKKVEDVAEGNKSVDMYIDEKLVSIPKDFGRIYVNKDSRTMVPIRFISEKLGHKVEWDQKTRTVLIDNGNIKMEIGSNTPVVEGVKTKMDTEAVLVAERTYVPIRFISEFLGYKVLYGRNSETNAVFIYKDTKPSNEILNAYINDVVDLDIWETVKEGGVIENVEEGGVWKEILGEQTHKNPGYIIDGDGMGLGRDFSITKVSGNWPKGLPAPIFYLESSPNGMTVYLPSMEIYGPHLSKAFVRVKHRDEQAIYDNCYTGPTHMAVANGIKDLSTLRKRTPFWEPLSTISPNAKVYDRHAAVYTTFWDNDKKTPLPWPKNNRFKTIIEIKAFDNNNKEYIITYNMDFNMVLN